MAAGAGVFQVDPAFRIVNRQHCGFYVWRVEVLAFLAFGSTFGPLPGLHFFLRIFLLGFVRKIGSC